MSRKLILNSISSIFGLNHGRSESYYISFSRFLRLWDISRKLCLPNLRKCLLSTIPSTMTPKPELAPNTQTNTDTDVPTTDPSKSDYTTSDFSTTVPIPTDFSNHIQSPSPSHPGTATYRSNMHRPLDIASCES